MSKKLYKTTYMLALIAVLCIKVLLVYDEMFCSSIIYNYSDSEPQLLQIESVMCNLIGYQSLIRYTVSHTVSIKP